MCTYSSKLNEGRIPGWKLSWILFPSATRWWHLSCLSLRHFVSPLNPQPEGLLCCSHPSGLKSSKARIFSCLSVYIHNRSGREWSIERILYMFVESQFCWHHLCDSDNYWASLNLSLKVKVLVTQPCQTLCDPMDCSPPGSSVQGILQARILEWVSIPFSFPTQGLSPYLLHGRQILYHLSPWNILLILKKKKKKEV